MMGSVCSRVVIPSWLAKGNFGDIVVALGFFVMSLITGMGSFCLDLEGNEVHRWQMPYSPGSWGYLPTAIYSICRSAPFYWGRGNGFAALGLAETLTRRPEDHPGREGILGAPHGWVVLAVPTGDNIYAQ